MLHARWRLIVPLFSTSLALTNVVVAQDFPQANGWSRVTPSVVWCRDPTSTATIEFHIVGRNDVVKVEVSNQFDDFSDAITLYDDGTHGDPLADDNTFIASGVQPYCPGFQLKHNDSVGQWIGFVRVTLNTGIQLSNRYGISAGLVRPRFKGVFPVDGFGNGLSATSHVFFIEDSSHQVIDNYPIAQVFCGTTNVEAYRKLYSVFPDVFDVAVVTPGLQIFRPDGFGENVPYNVRVRNDVAHIGISSLNDTNRFGSAGRLKSTVYESFGDIQIFDHEIAHTWGASIGASLGLLEDGFHWRAVSDIGGQLGAYYFKGDGGAGHFVYNGDGTWRWAPNSETRPYAPLELYIMGLIPPEEVPPIHILTNPDLSDLNRITAASVQTITIEQIIAAEGGMRAPGASESARAFKVAS